jgi:N-acetylglucosaminyl-diphospho-decaprenol L-rhamnosyltransferase
VLLNSDAETLGRALDTMWDYMESHPQVGIVGAQLLNSDLSLQPSGNKVPSLCKEVLQILPIRPLLGLLPKNRFYDRTRDYSIIAEVDEVSGACLMVRRTVWEKIGLLDEGFFFYYEDVDFCIRTRKAGWSVIYLPSAQVLHHWGASTNPADPAAAARILVSYYHFIRKVHGKTGEIVMRTLLILLTAGKFLIGTLASARGSTKYRRLASVNQRLLFVSLGQPTQSKT